MMIIQKLCLIPIICLLLSLQYASFAQVGQKTPKVIIHDQDFSKKGTKKEESVSVPDKVSEGFFVLENNYEDLFEDYKGKSIIDEKPQYKSRNSYVLEKIVYTKTEIILSLAFYFPAQSDAEITFHPLNHRHHWFLKDQSTGKRYSYESIHLIRKNGALELKQLSDSTVRIKAERKIQTVFTCRVHFKRLPNNCRIVDLIEGRGKAKDNDYFNFFNIKIAQHYLN